MLPFPKSHYPIYFERDQILARSPYYPAKCMCIACVTRNELYALFPRAFAWGLLFPPAWGWIGVRSIQSLFSAPNCHPTSQSVDVSANQYYQNASIQLKSRAATQVSCYHFEVRQQAKRFLKYSIAALICYGVVAGCLFVTISALMNIHQVQSINKFT